MSGHPIVSYKELYAKIEKTDYRILRRILYRGIYACRILQEAIDFYGGPSESDNDEYVIAVAASKALLEVYEPAEKGTYDKEIFWALVETINKRQKPIVIEITCGMICNIDRYILDEPDKMKAIEDLLIEKFKRPREVL